MRRETNLYTSIDWITVALYAVLVLMGLVNIYAAVYNEDHKSLFDFTQRYGKQFIWILASVFIIIMLLLFDSRVYSVFAWLIYGTMIFILAAVLVAGTEINASRAWFQIGTFRIQPTEFAKFATCLALAKYMSSYNFRIYRFRNLFIIAVIILAPVGLIFLQNDTGSALVFFALVLMLYREGLSGTFLIYGVVIIVLFILSMILNPVTVAIVLASLTVLFYWSVEQNLKESLFMILVYLLTFSSYFTAVRYGHFKLSQQFSVILIMGSTSVILLVWAMIKRLKTVYVIVFYLAVSVTFTSSIDYIFNNILEKHQQDRINELLGLKFDPLGTGYNVNQSKIAIGSGGFFGKGFLQGTQTKYDFVPEQSTDFIYCTVGEEWGFAGSAVVILLFLALLLRLVFLAERQRSAFNRIYGYGVISILFFHVAINVGMTIGILPVIGIPLPFFSYGGSSLWGFTILLFIFLRLDASRREVL
ncbi:MAG: rod shape-determining protein RodA [Bacteroidia bacterium]|nr:rod shape-determining protein RodA [Bacteroidia bacterium]